MEKLCDTRIVVNATALDRSGALSILKQFIENIPHGNQKWLIFVSPDIPLTNTNPNVWIEPKKGVKSMHKRFWWDAFGLNKWLKNNKVEPIACVSLQNTGFRVSKNKIPHYIYYHQSIPFFPYKWNVFKKQHRTLWFYKNIYPFFVKLFLNKENIIFVQLEFIKQGFIKRFKHPAENIKVYSPSVSNVAKSASVRPDLSNSLNIFYPATGNFYKNHRVLYDAIVRNGDKVNLYVNIPSNEPNVTSLGVIPFEEVCEMYWQCDALVYPSYIETFGLPLLEAALTGMPIIAADLPYAREVLNGYEGVTFVEYDDAFAWAEVIKKLKPGKRYNPIDISNRPSWKELFESIKVTI